MAVVIVLLFAGVAAYVSWGYYYPAFTNDPRAECEKIYLEAFDSAEVIEAHREAFPPSVECTLLYSGMESVHVAHRPPGPSGFLVWTVATHVVLIGGAFALIRRFSRRRSG